eukprot:3821-Eustigmatos_ZCMA.PRE.1
MSILAQVVGRRGAFMYQGRVLLGNLIHLGNRLADFLYPGTLLGAGMADFFHDVGDPANRRHDLFG